MQQEGQYIGEPVSFMSASTSTQAQLGRKLVDEVYNAMLRPFENDSQVVSVGAMTDIAARHRSRWAKIRLRAQV